MVVIGVLLQLICRCWAFSFQGRVRAKGCGPVTSALSGALSGALPSCSTWLLSKASTVTPGAKATLLSTVLLPSNNCALQGPLGGGAAAASCRERASIFAVLAATLTTPESNRKGPVANVESVLAASTSASTSAPTSATVTV